MFFLNGVALLDKVSKRVDAFEEELFSFLEDYDQLHFFQIGHD